MPWPWSASVVMGPMDTTTVLPRSASRSASKRPISAATRNRLSAWCALVNSATSTSPAANRSMAALSGLMSSGSAHPYTGTAVTRAPRCRSPASSSSLRAPYSWTATRFPATGSLRSSSESRSRQVFGSGHRERRREANLLERGDRFGPAADQREPSQRLHHLVLRPARRARGDQHPRADTGQQNQHIPVAGEECLAERECFALVGQRNLAHGRRLDRLAAVVADQFSHLRRPAALEADYPQPVQRVKHGTCLKLPEPHQHPGAILHPPKRTR